MHVNWLLLPQTDLSTYDISFWIEKRANILRPVVLYLPSSISLPNYVTLSFRRQPQMEPELHLISFMVLFNLFITFVSRYYSQTDLLSSFSIGDTLALISSAGDHRWHGH
jgi:hypothetical protein